MRWRLGRKFFFEGYGCLYFYAVMVFLRGSALMRIFENF